jgi:L-lactate dehydrogenase complex protein LldG
MSIRLSARERILKDLREATPWPKGEKAASRSPEAAAGAAADSGARIELFTTKAAAAAAVVKQVKTVAEAAQTVVSLMKEEGLSSAILSGEEVVRTAGIEPALKKAGIEAISLSPEPAAHKEACFTADAGITGAMYAVAETGSLALVFDAKNPRLVSHAPFCHIALLAAADILPDTETLFARIAERNVKPSAMALVTGPSMTADIALTPVRGIHGPGRLHIIIVG